MSFPELVQTQRLQRIDNIRLSDASLLAESKAELCTAATNTDFRYADTVVTTRFLSYQNILNIRDVLPLTTESRDFDVAASRLSDLGATTWTIFNGKAGHTWYMHTKSVSASISTPAVEADKSRTISLGCASEQILTRVRHTA